MEHGEHIALALQEAREELGSIERWLCCGLGNLEDRTKLIGDLIMALRHGLKLFELLLQTLLHAMALNGLPESSEHEQVESLR